MRRNEIKVQMYDQIRFFWRVVSGQQSEADRRSRSALRDLGEENARLRARLEVVEVVVQPMPPPPPLAPPLLPLENQLPAVLRGGRGRGRGGRGRAN